MESNKQNILIVIIIFLLVCGGLVFYFQQKSINQLKELVTRESPDSQMKTEKETSPENNSQQQSIAETAKNSINQQQKTVNFISGKVLQMSENSLKVEADIPDWKKMEEIASSPELSMEYENKMAPTVKKTYNVSIAGDTQFFGNQLSGIKAGDTVMVSAKELVYQTDNLTATKIVSPFDNAPPAGIQP